MALLFLGLATITGRLRSTRLDSVRIVIRSDAIVEITLVVTHKPIAVAH